MWCPRPVIWWHTHDVGFVSIRYVELTHLLHVTCIWLRIAVASYWLRCVWEIWGVQSMRMSTWVASLHWNCTLHDQMHQSLQQFRSFASMNESFESKNLIRWSHQRTSSIDLHSKDLGRSSNMKLTVVFDIVRKQRNSHWIFVWVSRWIRPI